MLLNRNKLKEYPFFGKFYFFRVKDESKPLHEREEEEVILLETACDIQESSKTDSAGMIKASFDVYFPFDGEDIQIKRGHFFAGSMYGLEVNGKILGIVPTQMGGCVAYLTDSDI